MNKIASLCPVNIGQNSVVILEALLAGARGSMLDQATLLDLLSNFQHQISTQASELAVQVQAGEGKAEETKERLRVVEIWITYCQKGIMEFGLLIDSCSAWSMDSEQQLHEIFS